MREILPGINVSERMDRCASSPLRDIFAAIERPGVVSFAGGLPDVEMFPDREEIVDAILGSFEINGKSDNNTRRNATPEFCQYGSSSGEPQLQEWAASCISESGLEVGPEQIIILSGSQQGIDLSAKLLIDQGTGVAVNSPTYLAALQSFTLFGARYDALFADAGGDYNLEESSAVYINPTFSNPTSINLSLRQRQQLALACDRFNTVLVEDDAYRELYYEDCERQPICSYLTRANWIYLASFSKTIAPGLRIGFMAVSEDLLPFMTRLKQASDLHSSRLAQQVIISLLQGDYAQKLDRLRQHYKNKRDHFHSILLSHWSDIADWQLPAGGMFFWLQLKEPLTCSLTELLTRSVDEGVAFMPGEYFYPANSGAENPEQMLRLNFTHAGSKEAVQGLIKLAALLKEHS